MTLTGEDGQPLVYPARLSDNHRDIAARYLRELPPEQRQPILDELEGRFRAEGKGMKPVYDAISFLHSLCKRVQQRRLSAQPGTRASAKHVVTRKRLIPNSLPLPLPPPPEETEERRQRRKAVCQAEIAKMRKLLGMRASTRNQEVTSES